MGELIRRLRYLLRWRQHDDELAEELALHRQLKEQELRERGLDVRAATSAAKRALGNDLAARQYVRDVMVWPWLQDLAQDIRVAARLVVRDRGFAVTALVVLGLGIGLNNMMFTLVYAHTLRGLPIDQPDRVLYISTLDERNTDRGLSYPEFQDLRAEARSFGSIAAFVSAPATLGDQGRAPDRFEGGYVSASALDVIGVRPAFGRTIGPDDDRVGAPAVAILGSGAWQSRYGRDATILGRSVIVNGAPATVIGILPEKSGFPSTAEVWLPLATAPAFANPRRDARMLRVFGRLRGDIGETDATAEVQSVADRIARQYPETNKGIRFHTAPINSRFFGRLTHPAWMAFTAASFLVVLISCANVANLMLARSIDRTREIAIRASLGATRSRVVRQLLIESSVLAALGGVAGLVISILGVRLFQMGVPTGVLPYWIHYTLDTRGFAALGAVSLGTVLVFGFVPALKASKTDVNAILKSSGRLHAGAGGTRRWTTAFMTAELALAVLLLATAVESATRERADVPSDTVIDTPDLLTAALTLPGEKYRTLEQRADFYARLDERLNAISAAGPASFASALPLRGGVEQQLDIDGRPPRDGDARPVVWTVAIGPRYFQTLELPLVRGRAFSDEAGLPSRNQVIVNQRFLGMHFPGEDPIGHTIRLTARNAPAQETAWIIVGIAPNVRQHPQPDPNPVVYTPFRAAAPATAMLLVRGSGHQAALTAFLREQVLALDPDVPLYRMQTMAQVIDDAEWNGRISARLIYTLTFIAFAVSLVGLYAVTAHAVSQRTQEIGIRTALGARPTQVAGLVLRRAAGLALLGLIAGVGCTIAFDATFYSGRIDLRFTRPSVLIPVCALLALVTLIACVVPVRRATRLDPLLALRHE